MQSIGSDKIILREGDLVSVGGQKAVILPDSHAGTGVSLEYWPPKPPKPPRPGAPRLVAHSQLGHSFWPRRTGGRHRYECGRCGMEKESGARITMTCKEYTLLKVVQAVHNL